MPGGILRYWDTYLQFSIDLRVRLEQGEGRKVQLSLAGPIFVKIGKVKLFALLCAKLVNVGRL